MKKSKRKIIIILLVLLLVAGAALGVYFALLTPEKRVDRLLVKGNDYLVSKEYEKADEAYDKALKIDKNNVEAMYGRLTALAFIGNQDEVTAKYGEYTSRILAFDDEDIASDEEYIVSLFCYAEVAYPKDIDMQIAVYESIYARINSNETLNQFITRVYMNKVSELEDIYEITKYCDKAIAIENKEEYITVKRNKIVESIEGYIAVADYDKAEEIINTYKENVTGIDYATFEEQIAFERLLIEKKQMVMEQAKQLISEEKYDELYTLADSEDAHFLYDNTEDYFIYNNEADSEFTGTGVAIYKYANGYYFYYGDFDKGKKCGDGTAFAITDAEHASYTVYSGQWDVDMPNGDGVCKNVHVIDENGSYYSLSETGKFVNGFLHGEISGVATSGDEVYTGTFAADVGNPSDVRENYTDYRFNVPSGFVLYAVLVNEADTNAWGFWIHEGGRLGVEMFLK